MIIAALVAESVMVAVWCAVAMTFYFTYGMHHSKLHTSSWIRHKQLDEATTALLQQQDDDVDDDDDDDVSSL